MYDAEIVIGDSVQVYKHLDIGSNKPSIEEQNEVFHHLINICETNEQISSGEFSRLASHAIQDISSRKKTPIVVGGSTMWIQWLVNGIPDNPQSSNEVYERSQELISPYEKNNQWDLAIENLCSYDENKIRTLNKNDWYRLSRCIEISMTKSKLGDHEQNRKEVTKLLKAFDVRCFFLSENREYLYRTIDNRCLEMLKIGLFEEVCDLILADKLPVDSMAARAIGYRQTIEYFCRKDFKENDTESFKAFLT